MARRKIDPAVVKRMAAKNTRDSYRLSGREVPSGFKRSEAAQRYIDEQAGRRRLDTPKSEGGQKAESDDAEQSGCE